MIPPSSESSFTEPQNSSLDSSHSSGNTTAEDQGTPHSSGDTTVEDQESSHSSGDMTVEGQEIEATHSNSPQITVTNSQAAPILLEVHSSIRVDSCGNITADARTEGPMTVIKHFC